MNMVKLDYFLIRLKVSDIKEKKRIMNGSSMSRKIIKEINFV
jgi:hypothetical protein